MTSFAIIANAGLSLGTCDVLFYVSNTLQSALGSGKEARIVLIDFSAVFE